MEASVSLGEDSALLLRRDREMWHERGRPVGRIMRVCVVQEPLAVWMATSSNVGICSASPRICLVAVRRHDMPRSWVARATPAAAALTPSTPGQAHHHALYQLAARALPALPGLAGTPAAHYPRMVPKGPGPQTRPPLLGGAQL